MNLSEKTERVTSAAEAKRTVRKHYEKPEVRFERVFETSALACGKVQNTQAGCHSNRKNS